MEDKVLKIKDKMSDIVTVADVTDIRLTQAGYYWDAGYNEFDFSCKINGEKDIIHMVQQRHDDGYGLVIRSEKDDMKAGVRLFCCLIQRLCRARARTA